MATYKVDILPESHAIVGEGPHWHIPSQSLYYVDIGAAKLLRYDYGEGKIYSCQVEGENFASFIIPLNGKPNEFAVGCSRRVVIIKWDGVSKSCKIERTLFEVQPDEKFKDNRFNDGKCDPQGRLFAGTMRCVGDLFEHHYGELFKYEKGVKAETVLTNLGIANGLAWDEKAKKFYFIDTVDYYVREYDYDFEAGVIKGDPKIILDLRKDQLHPDGMTLDVDGNLYVATVNGFTVYKINPKTSEVLLKIELPSKAITSVAFGGPNLDILYVTSKNEDDEPYPAGCTYQVTGLGVKGLPMTEMKL